MIQPTRITPGPIPGLPNQKIVEEIDAAISSVQTFLQNKEYTFPGFLETILPVLQQAREQLISNGMEYQPGSAVDDKKPAREVNPLQTLLNILPVGIVIVHDIERQDTTINRAGLQILNLPSDENPLRNPFGAQPLPYKFFRDGKELSPDEFPIQLAITQNMPLGNIEMEVRHSSGRVINLIVYASPLYDEKGTLSGSLGVMVDITARKLVEQHLVMQYAIAHILAESNTVNKAAPQVMQMICEIAHWEYGALWQVEADMLTLTNKGVWFEPGRDLSGFAEQARYSFVLADENSLPGYAMKKDGLTQLPDLAQFQSPYVEEARKAGLRSAYLLPVKSGQKLIAVLECLSDHEQNLDERMTDMLDAVGDQVGVFLERKVLEEALAVRATQQQLLAEAGLALSSSVDLEKRLHNIAHLVVPEIADWCAIDTIDRNNILHRIAAAHVDADKEALLYKIQPTREIDFNQTNTPQVQTLLTGQSLLYPDMPFSLIEKAITDQKQLKIIRELNPISSIVVPLIAHNQILGIFTFVQSDSGRKYMAADLDLAEDVARRTALAVENALLYAESQKLNSELEQRVDTRTAQLNIVIDKLREQIIERQSAEEEVRLLNSELEKRISIRTQELESVNIDLQKELQHRKKTSEALKGLLRRTRELYRISQAIGVVKTPNEVLRLLLSSSYLKAAGRASIALLDRAWTPDALPPEECVLLAEWNRGKTLPTFEGQHFTLEEYGVKVPTPYGQPIVILDIQSYGELPARVRKRFANLKTHSLIILPLIAGGEWYGLLSLHFKDKRMTNMDDLRHVRGLVDEVAIVIKNMRLLEAESQARQEAERANALKLKFLGMISHELRTPLTSIKGFATTLLADDVVWPEDKRRDFIETINAESDKLHELIEQLLDLSRLEAGVFRISPVETSLQRIIDSARPQLTAITADHDLMIEIPVNLPLIFADEQRIAQVITNLVNNAAKFSPAHTRIVLSIAPSNEEIIVKVTDDGPGIPARERQRVFTAFLQLENAGINRTKGAGLGLAICKGLIEAHQGRIWIQDQKEPGTTIAFTLPTIDNAKIPSGGQS